MVLRIGTINEPQKEVIIGFMVQPELIVDVINNLIKNF